MFGVANQLLAVIALAIGTSVLINMGKARYVWVTICPMLFVATTTLTAGWQKITSPDPKLGFLAHAQLLAETLASGRLPTGARSAAEVGRLIFNDRLDAGVAAFFMLAVVVILSASAREWVLVLRGRKPARSTEVPFPAHVPRTAVAGD